MHDDMILGQEDFRLGHWRVSPERLLIEQPDEKRQLGAKVMAILACLASAEGQTVTKQELIERVWQGAYTTDEALTTVVYELRKALGDDGRNPTFIGTVRGRGYRLLMPTLPAETMPPTAPTAPAPYGNVDTFESRAATSAALRRVISLGVAASMAIAMTGLITGYLETLPMNTVPMNPAMDQTLSVDGALDDVPTRIGDASKDRTQAKLSEPLAEALRVGDELLDDSPESARRFFDYAIEQQPTLALAHARKAESFLQSTRSEPIMTRHEWVEKARDAAGIALELDAGSTSAHASLGAIAFFHDGDATAAERHFAVGQLPASLDWGAEPSALALAKAEVPMSIEPPSPVGIAAYGSYLSATGRHDEAIALLDRVVDAKPESVARRLDLGRALYFARRYDAAREHLEQLHRLDPNEVRVARLRIDVDLADGRREDAIKACQQALALAGADDDVTEQLEAVYRSAGLLGVLRCLEQELATRADVDTLHLARYSAQSGDAASALRWLDAALHQDHQDLPWLHQDPAFDSLRGDQRFVDLLDTHGWQLLIKI